MLQHPQQHQQQPDGRASGDGGERRAGEFGGGCGERGGRGGHGRGSRDRGQRCASTGLQYLQLFQAAP